jgi:hypothetical protein
MMARKEEFSYGPERERKDCHEIATSMSQLDRTSTG